jgi:hypothetical protein
MIGQLAAIEEKKPLKVDHHTVRGAVAIILHGLQPSFFLTTKPTAAFYQLSCSGYSG